MSVINSQPLIGASGNQGGAYNLTRSLRFRSSASPYLSRTPASATNRKTWTWSGWVKRGALTENYTLFSAGQVDTGQNTNALRFGSSDNLDFYSNVNGVIAWRLTTTQVFRDPSAWYHIVIQVDTAQATSSNRMKIYVNGSQVTAFGTATYPSQDALTYLNSTLTHTIGNANGGSSYIQYFDGYMAEVNFVDGQALDASSFGETDTATGVWKPKKYTGTYGTNGFYLKFDNLTSTSTLGNDSSGNSNTWTVNNISLTSDATYDSMTDVPTLTSATVANYCVGNPLSSDTSAISPSGLTNGNLSWRVDNTRAIVGTTAMTSGQWYWEYTITNIITNIRVGIVSSARYFNGNNTDPSFYSDGYSYISSGSKENNNSTTAYGSSYTVNDVIGVAFDATAGTLTFYKNNVSQGTAYTGISGSFVAFAYGTGVGNTSCNVNFGQQPWVYSPPSGFVALNTFNLPTPTIGATASTQANKYFDVKTYTGTGSSLNITGLGFQPDLVWIKERNAAADHALYDAVRGVQKQLESNTTTAETTETTGLTAFNSDGFTVGALAQVNTNTDTYVAWAWDANGAGSSNTAGTITSTVSANTTAGFSIVTYTGTNTVSTVGHGLGVAPSMMIFKDRTNTFNWSVYHKSLPSANFCLLLNTTGAQLSSTAQFNDTAPTSSVFSVGVGGNTNASGANIVAYCFAEVAGYSRFGSYTGNGSTDGAFLFCGFRPRFVMVKQTNAVGNWLIWDTARTTRNQMQDYLVPNTADAEQNNVLVSIDALSNGFKCRTADNDINGNGDTYIFAAFAETPFKYSLGR